MKYSTLDQFSQAMRKACRAALNENVFYEDDFKKYVLKHMGGFDCPAVLEGVYSIDNNAENFLKTFQTMVKDVEDGIKKLPRGHYDIIERQGTSSHYSMIVSDGTGEIAVGGKFNSYEFVPTANQVLECMLGYEIYLCRKLIEKTNAEMLDISTMNTNKFSVGQVFKNLQSDEHFPTHKFSTTTIVEIRSDLQIKIESTKRGTKNTWSGLVSPTLLAKMIEWAAAKKDSKNNIHAEEASLFS